MDIRIEGFSKGFGDGPAVIEAMDLHIADGEMLALLGPSGCGKSTTLFAICGIHRMDGGRLRFGSRDVTELPAQSREVGVVFQSYALYPHMSAGENIGFPLRMRGEDAATIRRKVADMADLVHIGELLERRPAELSGGQQQRVALARALIRRPGVLLMDEPLANLDAKLRLEMRSEIKRIQRETGITAILVTHDQVEAMSMCDRIALMRAGRIVQIGTPLEMYREPETDYVASFLGNPPIAFLDGVLEEGHFRPASGDSLDLGARHSDGPVRLGIRPEHYGPEGALQLPGKVAFVEAQGRETLYDVNLEGGAMLRSVQPGQPATAPGGRVAWGVDPADVLIFDREGRRI